MNYDKGWGPALKFYGAAIVFAIAATALPLCSTGCSTAHAAKFKTKHGLVVDTSEAPWVTQEEIEVITEEFIKAANAHAAYFHDYKVYIYAEVVILNGKEHAGVYYGPRAERPRIEIAALDRRCFAQNSLAHELAHRWLDVDNRDPDSEHALRHWWGPSGIVKRTVKAASLRLCHSEKTTRQLLDRMRRSKR